MSIYNNIIIEARAAGPPLKPPLRRARFFISGPVVARERVLLLLLLIRAGGVPRAPFSAGLLTRGPLQINVCVLYYIL